MMNQLSIFVTFLALNQILLINCLEPNLCDAKRTTQCDEFAVCCHIGNQQYGCCPFTGGTCCPNTASCCPAGFECSESSGTCKRRRALS